MHLNAQTGKEEPMFLFTETGIVITIILLIIPILLGMILMFFRIRNIVRLTGTGITLKKQIGSSVIYLNCLTTNSLMVNGYGKGDQK